MEIYSDAFIVSQLFCALVLILNGCRDAAGNVIPGAAAVDPDLTAGGGNHSGVGHARIAGTASTVAAADLIEFDRAQSAHDLAPDRSNIDSVDWPPLT